MKKILPKLNLSKILTCLPIRLVLFAFLMSYTLGINAQSVANYSFNSSTGTYSEITGTGTGATGDGALSSAISIGFTTPFKYNGIEYTQVKVSTDGYVSLNTGTISNTYANDLASTSSESKKILLAALWDDLTSDDVQYLLSGTAPNQVFTVQWKNAKWYYSGTAGQNFQVKLYETTNIIEFIYGTMIVPSAPSASIGINDATGGSGHFISVTPATVPTTSTTTSNNSINAITYLTSGQTYTFTPYVVYDQTSIAEAPTAQVTAGNVSSIADTEGEAVDVFKFKITDAGSGDAKTTIVKQITVKPHASNTADWTDQIQGIRLHDGTSYITTGTVDISDTEIVIGIPSGNLVIADGGNKEITMSLYLNTSAIVDGDVLQFIIDYDAHGFASDYAGSLFATTFGAADINGNAMTIDVTATKLTYTTEPSTSAYITTNLDTPPVVTAYDANDNIDLGFTGTVALSNSGLIAMTGNSISAVAGLADFATLQFTAPGGPLTLTASSGSLTDAVTAGTITITNTPVVLLSEDFESGTFPPTGWLNEQIGDPAGWQETATQSHSTSHSAFHNDDNVTTGCNDWLITPGVTFDPTNPPKLVYWERVNYASSAEAHNVKISTDYVGSGDPSLATWTDINTDIGTNGIWKEKQFDLSAYSGTAYIAFQYTGDNDSEWWIDDVEISTIASAEMAYASSTVTQENTDLIVAGDVNNEIIGIQVVTNNTANPLSITNFSVNATGTTDINDIENAIIYYTGSSSVFDTEVDTFNLIAVAPVSGNFDISGDQELVAGTNYFWLTFGVKSSVLEGNVVDAECVNITVNSVVETPTVTAPAGTRSIKLPLTGTKTIGSGGDYATFTEAITELNALGIGTGGITFNVAQGETFDEVVPVIAVTGTAANPIIFQNDGTPGTNNPKITGTGTGSTDAGIILETVSYITFNGIDIECQASNDDNTKRLEYGYWFKGDASNNNITNCTVDLTKVNTSSKGIYMNGDNNDNNKFYNNTVQDCFSGYYFTDTGDANEIGTTGSGISTITDLGGTGNDVYGIYIAEQTAMKIFNNNIHNLTTDNDNIYGIYSYSSDNVIDIYNNKIYDISYTASAWSAYGICFNNVNTSNVYNNMIYSIKAENSSEGTFGLYIDDGTLVNVYYNTVYLDYTSADAGNESAAIYAAGKWASDATVDLRNNIFINKVNVASGGTAYAFLFGNSDYSKIVGTTNNNLYYAGTPGANNLIFYDKTNSAQTLAEYKALVATIEQQSITEANTPFVSTTGTYNLHLNDANTTQCESGGSAIGGYIDDIDTDGCRTGYPLGSQVNGGGTAPDIGADEGDFKPLDQTVPGITYTVFGNSASTTSRIIADITITDPSGINTTTAKPRAYYKRFADANEFNDNLNTSDGWKFVEANGTTTPFDFTIDYSLINGGTVALGDVIEYFIVAQDEATFPNVGINSGSFANAQASVDLASDAFPIGGTINSYEIVNAIAGTVNVGDGETYTSLTAAGGLFEALNTLTVDQNVTVNVTSDLTEDGTFALNKLSEEGGNFTITIQPDAAVNRNISGSYDGSLIRLSGGVDGIIFDGGLENNLTITNTSSSSCVAIEVGEASYDITVKNCNISTGGNSSATYGIYASGADISNITIQDNVITKAKYAIYLSGTFSSDNDGNTITGNEIGSDVIDSRISEYGVFVEYQTNLEISGNEIFNVINPNNRAYGICLSKSNNVVISKNNLHDIVFTGSVGYTAYGMCINVDDSDPVIDVVNNLIRHISGNDAPAGINIAGSATTGIGIYFNSIYLTPDSDHGLDHASAWAAAIIVEDGVSGIDLRNNILQTSIGKETASVYTSDGYAIYCEGTTMPFATIDNNIYYVDKHDNNYVGFGNSTDFADLATWKAWTTQDANSANEDPLFNSETELIPQTSSPVIGAGTPITGITDDYADVIRDVTTPSIGAYEEGSDVTAPEITYTVLDNYLSYDVREFTGIAITDINGVNVTTAKPRVYYKKSTDASVFNDNTNTTDGWKYAEANGAVSPFDFTIDYSILNGGTVSVNDTIEYFVVAQDEATTPNVSANPSTGFVGTSVSAITSASSTPNTYIVKEDDTPTVTFYPADAAVDVALDVAITLTFNKYMYLADGSEIDADTVAGLVELKENDMYGDDVAFTATINGTKDVITITPAADLEYGQDYYVTLKPNVVEDLSGNEINYGTAIFTTIPSSDATLIDLTIDDVTVTGFASGTYTYNVELPVGTTTVPTVDAMPTDSSDASYVVNNASALPGATTVVVTAQDGTTQLTYTINFTVTPASTDATLSDLTIDGTTVTGFASGTYTYNVELPAGTTTVPTVVATKNDANASVVVTDASALPGATTVVVTAEDGTTELTYTINFTVATGIDDLYGLSSQVTVYPNPCNGVFTLDINNENKKDYRVEIIDILGKVIYNYEFKQVDVLQKQIDISQFAKGIYFLKVNVENETGIKRILVQ